MAEKLYYSMGEVAEMFDVKPSLLRHWESQFSVLKPKRNKKGNRLFTPADVENLKLIYHLVKEQGMTLDGAKKALKQRRSDRAVPRDVELLERLQHIRSLLVEVREELKAGAGEIITDDEQDAAAESVWNEEPASAPRAAKKGKAVVKIPDGVNDGAEPAGEAAGKKRPMIRKPRRKKEETENKELFAFYEQSLF